jgi:hypothetical protein
MPMKAHIEGTPSSIRMASKERIAMHLAPRIAICSGGESKRLVQCVHTIFLKNTLFFIFSPSLTEHMFEIFIYIL